MKIFILCINFFWTKKSHTLYRKIKIKNITKFSDVVEIYWFNIATKQGIKGTSYDKSKFIHTRTLFNHSLFLIFFFNGYNFYIIYL